MARLRYVKAGPTGGPGAPRTPRKLSHRVQSIRALYETEPEIARAVLPRPLVPAAEPHVFVQFANVAMQVSPTRTVEIGAATVGIACSHAGCAGYYVLAMPMEGEFVVIGGRERYGEPKKLAKTQFSLEGGRMRGQVSRHGVTFLELNGTLGEPAVQARKQFTEYFYCFKAQPAAADGVTSSGGFDGDVLLTKLTWEREYSSVRTIDDGHIVLRESKWDPLVDVPVKRVVRMEFAEGASRTSGEVIRKVPGEWLKPFMVQRYDEPQHGVEIALAAEAHAASSGAPSQPEAGA